MLSSIPGVLRMACQDPLTSGLHANRTGAIDGENITLTFTAGHVGDGNNSYSIPSVQWFKNGLPAAAQPMNTAVGMNGRLKSVLSFTFSAPDVGVYQCTFTDTSSHMFISVPLRIDSGKFFKN